MNEQLVLMETAKVVVQISIVGSLIWLLYLPFVLIHEGGHFVAAKLVGIEVEEFAIGTTPFIVNRTIRGTKYRIGIGGLGGHLGVKNSKLLDSRKLIIIVSGGVLLPIVLGLILAGTFQGISVEFLRLVLLLSLYNLIPKTDEQNQSDGRILILLSFSGLESSVLFVVIKALLAGGITLVAFNSFGFIFGIIFLLRASTEIFSTLKLLVGMVFLWWLARRRGENAPIRQLPKPSDFVPGVLSLRWALAYVIGLGLIVSLVTYLGAGVFDLDGVFRDYLNFLSSAL